jgi:DNA modification methylase
MKHSAFFISTLFIVLICIQVVAQSTPSPVLKSPSLDAFLSTVDSELKADGSLESQSQQLIDVAEAEFIFRYLKNANYAERRRAYDVLKVAFSFYPVAIPRIDSNQWIAWILDAWFAEHTVNLDSLKKLHFDDFDATIEQRDFNGDGVHEWLLDLTKSAEKNYFEYANWIIVERENNSYHAVPVPLFPGYNGSWDYPSAYAQRPREAKLVDITADGIPEWFIYTDGSAAGSSPNPFTKESILGWQDGRMVSLIDYTYPYPPDTFSEVNLDSDPALELSSGEVEEDSWGCTTVTRSVYDWDGHTFTRLGKPIVEKHNCTAREAEEAMWRGDFRKAVDGYERFLYAHKRDYLSKLHLWA